MNLPTIKLTIQFSAEARRIAKEYADRLEAEAKRIIASGDQLCTVTATSDDRAKARQDLEDKVSTAVDAMGGDNQDMANAERALTYQLLYRRYGIRLDICDELIRKPFMKRSDA